MNKTTKILINLMLGLINFILFSISGIHLYYFMIDKKGGNNGKEQKRKI